MFSFSEESSWFLQPYMLLRIAIASIPTFVRICDVERMLPLSFFGFFLAESRFLRKCPKNNTQQKLRFCVQTLWTVQPEWRDHYFVNTIHGISMIHSLWETPYCLMVSLMQAGQGGYKGLYGCVSLPNDNHQWSATSKWTMTSPIPKDWFGHVSSPFSSVELSIGHLHITLYPCHVHCTNSKASCLLCGQFYCLFLSGRMKVTS